jgi:hypothetical protein
MLGEDVVLIPPDADAEPLPDVFATAIFDD